MKVVGLIILGLIGIVFVVFAIHNYHDATVNLWPAPLALALPLFVIVFGAIVLGFIGGAVVAWLAGSKNRRKAREIRRTARQLETQVEATGQVPAVRPA